MNFLIFFLSLFTILPLGTGESCTISKTDHLNYCEGFEREFPAPGWQLSETDGSPDWKRIFLFGPDGISTRNECSGKYFIYPQNSNSNGAQEYTLISPVFHLEPTWKNFFFQFFAVAPDPEDINTILEQLKVQIKFVGENARIVEFFPCEFDTDTCHYYFSGGWQFLYFSISNLFESTDESAQFIFKYQHEQGKEIALDNILFVVMDEAKEASSTYTDFGDRCDVYWPPHRQWDQATDDDDDSANDDTGTDDDDDSSDDDNDDEGCGCGAVDSDAGGSGFFAFALLALCLILLYRKRAQVV